MKNIFLSYLVITMSLISFTAFSQTENNQDLLGLPGDNLDLYAVLNLFQKSKTIEDFEKSLNEEATGINNLDLNNDEKVDFIKVETKKDGDDFLFILQDPISEKETQDVAVISVAKDKDGTIALQIIGDKDLYGKDYVIEPITKATPAVTANPGYTGNEPPVESVPASTTVVVVESAPIVQYVYSPAYVPYYPPYYYGFYPPYYRAFTVMAVGIYRHNNWYHHGGYHGGYHGHGGGGNTININRNNQINHYNNNSRNTSSTVNNNVKKGNYNTAGKGTTRASTSQTGKASTGSGSYTRPSTSQTNRPSSGTSTSSRPSSSNYSSGSRSRASSSSYSRPTSSSRGSMSRGGGGRRR